LAESAEQLDKDDVTSQLQVNQNQVRKLMEHSVPAQDKSSESNAIQNSKKK